MRRGFFLLLLLGVYAGPGSAQKFDPPKIQVPEESVLKAITQKAEYLGKQIATLRRLGVRDPWLADIEVYHQGVLALVEHQEYYNKDSAQWALNALDRGLLRASQAGRGDTPWAVASGTSIIRGYRSRVDGSVQPFAVTLPLEYGRDPGKKWRLDVVLHGRDSTITEVKFLNTHGGDKPAPKDQDFVKIDIFGRGNNAYRWAGETDVIEAIEAFFKYEKFVGRDIVDPARIVLRGFSMGGAGTWHLGLHTPDRWAVIGPGAGFTTTHGYIKDLPAQLPYYQENCLRIYDAIDYAENAFNVPIVAYSGEKDPQKRAADNIENSLKKLGIPMIHLIAPDLEHKFPPEWVKKADAYWSKYANQGKPEYPQKVKFVTYTLKYPGAYWVEILGMDSHYQQARVEAEHKEEGLVVKTANVRQLRLSLPEFAKPAAYVVIDGEKLPIKPTVLPGGSPSLYLQKRPDGWHSVLPQRILTERSQKLQKYPGMTGPIDDAFTDAFLCVRGTGKPWHEATQKYADENLKRFQAEWSKFLRGQVPIKDDEDVTHEDIASRHLILFGDPASNSLIAQVADALPLKWTKDSVEMQGRKGSAADHVPVMIYPNPLNPARYVVLNSGHTFHAAEFRGTNAQLYPRLGDYALLKLTGEGPLGMEVVNAGLFDDFWRLPR